jgi:hypothetical protein
MPVRSHVDWAAIFAGAALATAIGLILLTFGASLGLSVASPYDGEGYSPVAYAVAAGLYLLWVQLMSFGFGGYVTARLRVRTTDTTEHEIDVRDGLHGLVMWGVGVVAAAVIAIAGLGGAAAASHMPDSRANISDSVSRVVADKVAESAAEEKATDANGAVATETERRAEVARKFTIISAFITAASLLAGAVVAFIFAGIGGRHRDDNVTVQMFALRKSSKLW